MKTISSPNKNFVRRIIKHYLKYDKENPFEVNNRVLTILGSPAALALLAEQDDKVVAFAYGARWRDKPAYAKSVETTIYVHPDYKHTGIGEPLYKKLIETLTQMNFHLLVAGMTMPNAGSQKLHEKLGFEKVGEFKDAGMKFGQWHNVGFWQKIVTQIHL